MLTLDEKIKLYSERRQLIVGLSLGSGQQGSVYEVSSLVNATRFAIKFHKNPEPYWRERRAYECLTKNGISEIADFHVPELLGFDDELLVIEMTIVEPPFLLDFGGAYEEGAIPDFPENVWMEWREQKQEEFGARWPIVEDVLMLLRSYGIFMMDIHPRNITFREERIRT
jgi:hypothetical protein